MRKPLESYIGRSLNREIRRNDAKLICPSASNVFGDVHDGLRIMLGPNYRRLIEDRMANDTFKGSEERFYLVTAIKSALAQPKRPREQLPIGEYDPSSGEAKDNWIDLLAERVDALGPAMAELDPEEQRLIRMHYLEEQSFRQMAKELGVSRSTLRDRVVKLTKKMLVILESDKSDSN